MKYLARFIMWLAGWKYKDELPAEKKAVLYLFLILRIGISSGENWLF